MNKISDKFNAAKKMEKEFQKKLKQLAKNQKNLDKLLPDGGAADKEQILQELADKEMKNFLVKKGDEFTKDLFKDVE